jgi:D-galactose 1-dehydrogenase
LIAHHKHSGEVNMKHPTAIAIVGLGKIARDSHVPAISSHPGFNLCATVDPSGAALDGVPAFASLTDLLAGGPRIDAIAVCTPPVARAKIAREALAADLDVLLEKPPAATLGELASLRCLADASGRVLFAAWHSRFAPMVAHARAWVEGRTIARGTLRWHEDARKWHPGQTWLWEPGGLGVFDPAINGFSILSTIFAGPFEVRSATFEVPDGAHTPIASQLTLAVGGTEIRCDLSFRAIQDECWQIDLEDEHGSQLHLTAGGHSLAIDGRSIAGPSHAEYDLVYARFGDLITARLGETDDAPLKIVADAYLVGRSRMVERFVA